MPGTTILFDSVRLEKACAEVSGRALAKMEHYPNYTSRHAYQDDHLLMGAVTFPGYPLIEKKIEDRYHVRLEGAVYGEDMEGGVLDKLGRLCRLIGQASIGESVAELTASWDGEYLVVLYDTRDHRLVVFNDSLGRLPAYFCEAGGRLILSREVKYMAYFRGAMNFDREGVMQYLLFGSALGSSTLIEGVRSLPAGAVLTFAPGSRLECRSRGLFLRPGKEDKRTRQEIARCLADRLVEGLEGRQKALGGRTPVVSLSGGLDSRAVLAGLCRLGLSPKAVTLQGPEEGAARKVADRFKVGLSVMAETQGEEKEAYLRYAWLKDGLDCHPGLPRLHRFMEELLRVVDPTPAYFTGIMGGEITRHYNVTSGLGSTADVARHLLDTKGYYKYSSQKVAAILGMKGGEILDLLVALLESLPPQDPVGKYLAFRHEFYRRYTGEAEDRNRYYCWTFTPFYALNFYKEAMVLDEARKGIWLWRDVLRCIDARSIEEPYFNRGISMKSDAAMMAFTMLERVVRGAPVKRAAQGLIYSASKLRSRIGRRGDPPLRKSLMELLSGLVNVPPFSSKLDDLVGAEEDTLGLERMLILSCYAQRMTGNAAQGTRVAR